MTGSLKPDTDRWRRIEALLDELLELEPEERPARLHWLCGDDRALRAEVEALLAADHEAGGAGFLAAPAADSVVDWLDAAEPARPSAPPRPPLEGRRIGPYAILRLIGSGGMGRVYEAHDSRLGRRVALKLLGAELGPSALAKERFLREARAASRLDHPHIVTVHDLGETSEGELYLVTAFYDGETLGQRLARGPLSFAEARSVTLAVARALACAHDAGILHRDIKPGNIMLPTGREGAGEAKVLDFGIARIAGEIGPTQTGHAPGTPAYMAPEQARGEPLDERTDLWALGATLYEMLTGRRAFPGDDAQAVIYGLLHREPEPLSRLRPETPADLARVVARLLAKNPAERPANAWDLLAELSAAESPPSSHPTHADSPFAPPAGGLAARPAPLLRVLVATELRVGATQLDDERAFSLASRHDRAARDLVARCGGLEVEKSTGFLLLFERAADAVGFALAYQQTVTRLAQGEGIELAARVGLHLGEVLLRRNPEADISRGARPIEVAGLAKAIAARVLALSMPHQTLLTRAVFDLARRAALAGELENSALSWLAHGSYAPIGAGADEALEIFEVGVRGFAPLAEPPSSAAARRVVAPGDELALGWRPATGQPVPRRPNWTLTQRLGEGGYGEVWLAEHRSGERRVFKFCFEAARLRALKREVTLFRLLKDALGHRHDIARILDWSFEQAPYFLESEYSEGGNLVDWAATQGGLGAIPLALRLELAAEVAEALAAAHSVGILHKDVKPENVLIAADRDGRPHARLTDFGIGLVDPGATAALPSATALGSGLGFTAVGLPSGAAATESTGGGSVRYMAPELLEGKPASIQGDLYSLGVLIYQLVASDFSRALAPGWRRDVADELLAEDLATFVDGRPERRPASAAAVAESLRTLETRRARREEVRRAEQVAAATQAALERQVRQRKVALWIAAAAVVVLVGVGVLTVREQRARRVATLRQQQAEGLIGYMLGDLRDKLEPVGRLEILDGVGAKAMEYFGAVPVAELSDDELARRSQALYQIGDVRMRQGKLGEAIAPLEESLALARELADRDPENSQRLFDLAQSHFWLGYAGLEQGELEPARTQFESYLALARELVTREPGNTTWRQELSYALTNLGAVEESSGNLDRAVELLRQSLVIKQELAAARPGDRERQRAVAGGHSWLARILAKQGDLRGSLGEYEREQVIRKLLLHKEPDDANARRLLATNLSHVADLHWNLGHVQAALRELQEMRQHLLHLTSLDPDNDDWKRDLAVNHRQLGERWLALGEGPKAGHELASAQLLLDELAAPSSRSFDWQLEKARVELGVAAAALVRGDLATSRHRAKETLARVSSLLAKKPKDTLVQSLLAQTHLLAGRIEAVAGHAEEARSSWQRALSGLDAAARGSEDPLLLDPWAQALFLLGRNEEANHLARRLSAQGYARPGFLVP